VQYKALVKEYQEADRAFREAYFKAKTREEQQKVYAEKYPRKDKFAPKFLELAERHPKEAMALNALTWAIMLAEPGIVTGAREVRSRALDLLLRDHVGSDMLVEAVEVLGVDVDRKAVGFLRTLLEKSPHKAVRAEACLTLAQCLDQRAQYARALKDNPELAKQLEESLGKEMLDELKKADPAQLEAEVAKVHRELSDTFLGDLGAPRLIQFCQRLSYRGDKSSDTFLRALLEKDKRRDVQGAACLTLALALAKQADALFKTDAKAADELRAECHKLLLRAAADFGDVKSYGGTIAERAKTQLFDLHHLSVGKEAPEVEGQDQEGKMFRLSDYKGKVVLLDFWSQN
jgi:hypothetical protein